MSEAREIALIVICAGFGGGAFVAAALWGLSKVIEACK